jgi:hypothetical protein
MQQQQDAQGLFLKAIGKTEAEISAKKRKRLDCGLARRLKQDHKYDVSY